MRSRILLYIAVSDYIGARADYTKQMTDESNGVEEEASELTIFPCELVVLDGRHAMSWWRRRREGGDCI
jgi:hypothetical protein